MKRICFLIPKHGKSSAYLEDGEYYEQIHKKITLLKGLVEGEKAILEDRTIPHSEARKRMSRWLD